MKLIKWMIKILSCLFTLSLWAQSYPLPFKEFRPIGGKLTLGNHSPQLGVVENLEFHCLKMSQNETGKCDLFLPVEHTIKGENDHRIIVIDKDLSFTRDDLFDYRDLLKFEDYQKHFNHVMARRIRYDNRFVLFPETREAYEKMLKLESRFPWLNIVTSIPDDVGSLPENYLSHKLKQRQILKHHKLGMTAAYEMVLAGQWIVIHPQGEAGLGELTKGTNGVDTLKKVNRLFFRDIKDYIKELKKEVDFPEL